MNEKVVTLPLIAPSEYTDSSRLIHSGPCIVKMVHVAYTGAVLGICRVYDGVNDLGALKAIIAVPANSSYSWRPGEGTDFDYGIYVYVGTDVTATVTFIPESRKAFI